MSGPHQPTILPKPMNSYPALAPKANISGHHSNGDNFDAGVSQTTKREVGNGQESRLLGQKYLDEANQRRTSQRKRAKVCVLFTVLICHSCYARILNNWCCDGWVCLGHFTIYQEQIMFIETSEQRAVLTLNN